MESGYIFLSLKPGIKRDFIKKAQVVEGVKEARLILGIFDAILKIESETIEELKKIYFNKIDKIEGIKSSRLHIVACPRYG